MASNLSSRLALKSDQSSSEAGESGDLRNAFSTSQGSLSFRQWQMCLASVADTRGPGICYSRSSTFLH